MVSVIYFDSDVNCEVDRQQAKEDEWQTDEDTHAIEAEIEHVLDLVSSDEIDIRDAAARLEELYTSLRQVGDGPRWDDFIPFDGSVMPPEVADDGYPVYVWPGMYMEVS